MHRKKRAPHNAGLTRLRENTTAPLWSPLSDFVTAAAAKLTSAFTYAAYERNCTKRRTQASRSASRELRIFTRTITSAVALVLLITGPLLCQQAPPQAQSQTQSKDTSAQAAPAPPEAELTLRVETNLVQIPVAVTDSLNRFVLGLQKQDFQLLEDGVEQKLAHFSGEDAPLSIGLVFDESGSMDYKLRNAQSAVTHFLKTMNGGDEVFLVEFNDSAKVSTPFTGNIEEVENALQKAQPSGLTALLDAVHLALAEMKKAKNSRKAIIVISDGGDNHSQYTAQQIESLVREADVQIYAMGVFEPSFSFGLPNEQISGPKLLSEIATQTGGRAFAAALTSDLPSVAARIAVELRNQYVVGYYPKNQSTDGKYRKVEVKLTQPPGVSPLKAHWRLGYYAPSQ